jgi:(R)-2-hydroxyacyl-CoA dehydratese activating ATPase
MSERSDVATGIDIGSRTTKIVRIAGDGAFGMTMFDTAHDSMTRVVDEVDGERPDMIVATGYGRRRARSMLGCDTVTEIRACARGSYHVAPECTAVIDIGGQDCKAIELDGAGGFRRFEMNDRCAAGTGRFLEVMAAALGYGSVEEFGRDALEADESVTINSMCTVFAESEVISLIARGQDRRRIALGLHESVAGRVSIMAQRITLGDTVLFVGGVANNPAARKILSRELAPCKVIVPENPEMTVACGAALLAVETEKTP